MPPLLWDSPSVGPGDGSAVLVYSPQIQAELAAIRQVLSFGMALILMFLAAMFLAKR